MATDKKEENETPQNAEIEAGDEGDQSDDQPSVPTRRPAQGPRVGVAQIEPALGDIETNLERHAEAAAKARDEGVDVLVFPELSLTGYRLKDTVPDVALTRSDPVIARIAALSHDISLVVGLVLEAKDHSFFNGSAYFEGGEILHVHRKVYLPTYGMFDEQRYFARGNRFSAFDTKHGRMAILICEDMLHPSAVTIAALDGASTVLVPSASPVRGVIRAGEEEQPEEISRDGVDANGRSWENYNRTMARALGVFVVHANRVGVEDGQTFWGGSEIIGPDGTTLAKAAYYDTDTTSAVLPDSEIRRQRIQAPVLRDEDIDLTINELCRVRGRLRPAFPREEARGRSEGRGGGDSRGFGRPREGGPDRGRGGGRDDRGFDRRTDRRDDRGGGRDDRRGGDRRDGRDSRGYDRRDDRRDNRGSDRRDSGRDNRGSDRRDSGRDNRGYDRRDSGRDNRPRPPRDGDRPLERRGRSGDSFGGGYGKPSDDQRSGDSHGPPSRERPGRGERKPRPVGGGPGRPRDKGDS